MRFEVFSHHNGDRVVAAACRNDVAASIGSLELPIERLAARSIGRSIADQLLKRGWSQKVKIVRASQITITSAKDRVGLCLQTGNMSRMYADVLKLQQMFCAGGIDSGIIIVPSKQAAKTLGDNIANSARLCRELDIFGHVIQIPLLVYSIG